MKKIRTIIGLILICCLILLAVFLYETNRQRDLAMKVAFNFVSNVLKNQNKLEKYNIPTKGLNAEVRLVDTNHYFNNWQFIFTAPGINGIEVIITPKKSIGFIPLFNKEKELTVVGFNYLK